MCGPRGGPRPRRVTNGSPTNFYLTRGTNEFLPTPRAAICSSSSAPRPGPACWCFQQDAGPAPGTPRGQWETKTVLALSWSAARPRPGIPAIGLGNRQHSRRGYFENQKFVFAPAQVLQNKVRLGQHAKKYFSNRSESPFADIFRCGCKDFSSHS